MNLSPTSRSSETWLIAAIVALLIYLPWAWGGTPIRLQFPLPWFGLLYLVLIFLVPAIYRGQHSTCHSVACSAGRLLKDPVFYTGGLLLILLAIQWWNAGRYIFFNPILKAWNYTAPAIPWLPSAFTRIEAKEMLVWFFPSWAMVLAIRNPGISSKCMLTIWKCMAFNAGAIAILGILQDITGASGVLWSKKIPDGAFFASFGYVNHAPAFFTLMLCLSAGLCLNELYSRTDPNMGRQWSLLLATAVLCLAGATFSLSRAGMILAWIGLVALVLYTIIRGWRRMIPVHRLNISILLLGSVCFIFFIIGGLPGHTVLTELSTLKVYTPDGILSDIRIVLYQSAIEMWQQSPWFGIGGWGFASIIPLHIANWQTFHSHGLANVHNDFLQFLVEFGAVGTILLIATIFALLWPLPRTRVWKHPIAFCIVLGLILTFFHSLIDLPFRCPAILYSSFAMLAGAGALAKRHIEREDLF